MAAMIFGGIVDEDQEKCNLLCPLFAPTMSQLYNIIGGA
jgi:hypothetical protein